ncbi:cyclin-D2-2 [Capsicum galapagoense]
MDFASSNLFSAEDTNTILENEYHDAGTLVPRNHQNSQQTQILIGVPLQSDECVALLIKKECEHMPCGDYLEKLANGEFGFAERGEILDWMYKVHSHFSFGPLCLYLAVNYLDRFLSACDLPKENVWSIQLLAVTCLSLAAKMEETQAPLSLDLQIEGARFVFEARTIKRMELVLLSKLKWRMQPVTPFSFIDYFLRKTNGDQIASSASITKAVNVILGTLKGIHFLEFKPSEIAAAAVISVVEKNETVGTENATYALLVQVQEDRVKKCVEFIQESYLLSDLVDSTPFAPQSPIGVLDDSYLNYQRDDSGANFADDGPATKRAKMNE